MTSADPPTPFAAPRVPASRWWRKVVLRGDPPRFRPVLRWGRILGVAGMLGTLGYLALVTALWGYYGIHRRIPGVRWVDVAFLPHFSRVQAAVGAFYLAEARALYDKGDFSRAVFTGRAAVFKAPHNVDARLFLAGCWQQGGRIDEAIETLRDGLATSADDPRLQQALINTCLVTAHYEDVLTLLRQEFPAHGVELLRGAGHDYQMAEVRAVFETVGAAAAAGLAQRYPGLADLPTAAPLLAWIDLEQQRPERALQRLAEARDRSPQDPTIQDAYVETALRMGRHDEARAAAQRFLVVFPGLRMAQLRFLETHAPRPGVDRKPWLTGLLRFLVQHRHDRAALMPLARLAAAQGWTDVAYLLYQNSLHENLTGFPFVLEYVGSLVKTGDSTKANALWNQLLVRHAAELTQAPQLEAMILWGVGHESESLQIIERLRRQTTNEARRRRELANTFRRFGFPEMATELMRAPAPAARPEIPAAG